MAEFLGRFVSGSIIKVSKFAIRQSNSPHSCHDETQLGATFLTITVIIYSINISNIETISFGGDAGIREPGPEISPIIFSTCIVDYLILGATNANRQAFAFSRPTVVSR